MLYVDLIVNKCNRINKLVNSINYNIIKRDSVYYTNESDYFLFFECDNIHYVFCFIYVKINNIFTYNVNLVSEEVYYKWINNEINILEDYFSDIYLIILQRVLSNILKKFYETYLKNQILSVKENINLEIFGYNNIIKFTYPNIKEEVVLDELNNKVYLFYID